MIVHDIIYATCIRVERISTGRIITDVVRQLNRHMIFVVIKFSIISRKRHYRKSMRNTSRHIRTHLLETDNDVFTRVNIKSPASFPEVLFPVRKQSRRAASSSLPLSSNSQKRVSIPSVLFSVFHRVIGENHVSPVLIHAPSVHSSRARTRNGSRQNQGLTRVHIPLYNGKTSDGLLHVTWENRIY